MHCYDWAAAQYRQLITDAVVKLDEQRYQHRAILGRELTDPDRYQPFVDRMVSYWDAIQGRPNVRR